ncbi:MAG: Hsp33 family molecular chaperone HslO [Pseudomonadota bacterium]
MSQDTLRRFIFEQKDIKGAWVSLDSSIEDLYRQQDESPAILKQHLNESLAASVLLSTMLKFEGMLSLQARGDGDINVLLAETHKGANDAISVRGIVRTHEGRELSPKKINLSDLLGQAHLVVSIQPDGAQPYQGMVALEHASLADNLSAYFVQSEQLDTYFHIASDDGRVVAFMLQRLPDSQGIDEAEANERWSHCVQLCQTMSNDELLSIDDQTMLYRLFHEEEIRLFDVETVRFECGCSKERMEKALISVGQKDVMEMFTEKPSIDMRCELCGSEYNFDIGAVSELFNLTQSEQIN